MLLVKAQQTKTKKGGKRQQDYSGPLVSVGNLFQDLFISKATVTVFLNANWSLELQDEVYGAHGNKSILNYYPVKRNQIANIKSLKLNPLTWWCYHGGK